MKRLAKCPIFAAALLAVQIMAAAQNSVAGEAAGNDNLGPEFNGLAGPDGLETIAAGTSGQILAPCAEVVA